MDEPVVGRLTRIADVLSEIAFYGLIVAICQIVGCARGCGS